MRLRRSRRARPRRAIARVRNMPQVIYIYKRKIVSEERKPTSILREGQLSRVIVVCESEPVSNALTGRCRMWAVSLELHRLFEAAALGLERCT